MPEHIRALVVIMAFAGCFWYYFNPVIAQLTTSGTAKTWRNLWFGLTAVGFLAGNFWIYALVVCFVLLYKKITPVDALALYVLLILIIPAANTNVPGFGLINYVFTLNHPRLLSLVLLFPAAVKLFSGFSRRNPESIWPDRFLFAYILLVGVLQARNSNVTGVLRECFYLFLDVVLVYYVASRSLRSVDDFKRVFTAFLIAASILGLLATFETLKHWNLFQAVVYVLDVSWGYTGYLGRDGTLRAKVSAGQPIVLGYVMMIGLGFGIFLRNCEKNKLNTFVPLILVLFGLLASVSRGPWVGALIMYLVFLWQRKNGYKKVVLFTVFSVLIVIAMIALGIGQKYINLIPFVGQTDAGSVTYRQDLFDSAMIVIYRNFLFGSVNYLQTPEMLRMIQGEGIIDIVNSYLRVTLDYGVVGLSLFVGFFGCLLLRLYKLGNSIPYDGDLNLLGRSIMAILFGILITIATVSSILVVPIFYWFVGGLAVAWMGLASEYIKHRKIL